MLISGVNSATVRLRTASDVDPIGFSGKRGKTDMTPWEMILEGIRWIISGVLLSVLIYLVPQAWRNLKRKGR
jgi:hypothetical protein